MSSDKQEVYYYKTIILLLSNFYIVYIKIEFEVLSFAVAQILAKCQLCSKSLPTFIIPLAKKSLFNISHNKSR